MPAFYGSPAERKKSLAPDVLSRVIDAERKATTLPRNEREIDAAVVDEAGLPATLAGPWGFSAGDNGAEDDDEYDDDYEAEGYEDEDDGPGLFDDTDVDEPDDLGAFPWAMPLMAR